MNFDLGSRTVFLTLSGSRAYGFAEPTSDWDYRGVAIAPLGSYIGLASKFEQAVDTDKSKHVYKHYPPELVHADSDMQVMELTKFARLAVQCNPSVIEILFSDTNAIVSKLPVMEKLLASRDLFLSKQAKVRFCGYAHSQLKRIQRHKKLLDSPPSRMPLRSEFGLPEYKAISMDQLGAADALIKKEVDAFVVDQNNLTEDTKIELTNSLGKMIKTIWSALHTEKYPIGEGEKYSSIEDVLFEAVAAEQQFSQNFIEVLKNEKRYRSAKQEWDSYQRWLVERNPARAALEAKFGFDRKHAAHLVRLIRMAREIITTGEVKVLRPDADEIKAIRNGAWTYEEIVSFAEKEDIALNDLVKASTLPKAPPMNKIHDLIFEMVMSFNFQKLNMNENIIYDIVSGLLTSSNNSEEGFIV